MGEDFNPKQAIFAVRCASQKPVFAAICALTEEIRCDTDHDASVTCSAMLRCGELSFDVEVDFSLPFFILVALLVCSCLCCCCRFR